MSVILGIRTDGDQDSWTNLHQNRVRMVDFEVKKRENENGFEREQKRKAETRKEKIISDKEHESGLSDSLNRLTG